MNGAREVQCKTVGHQPIVASGSNVQNGRFDLQYCLVETPPHEPDTSPPKKLPPDHQPTHAKIAAAAAEQREIVVRDVDDCYRSVEMVKLVARNVIYNALGDAEVLDVRVQRSNWCRRRIHSGCSGGR
jgi:hypothetical protein